MIFKNRVIFSLSMILVMLIVTITISLADSGTPGNKIKLIMDGEEVNDGIEPVVESNVVYVPAKTVCEYLGADFVYSDIDGKIDFYLSDATVELLLDAPYADINTGTIVNLENPPIKIGDNIMIPQELVKLAFQAKVKYDDSKKAVYIDYFSQMSGKLTIGGSTSFINVSQMVVDKLKKLSPDFDALVIGGGTAAGVNSCASGEFDIANLSRDLYPEERGSYPDLVSYRVAKEGIAVIVNPKNPLNDLTQAQICKIFEGKYLSWRAAKGEDMPIFVNVQEAGSGTLNSFYEIAIRGADEVGEFSRTAIPNSSNGLVRQAVATEPLAVGFVTFPFVNDTVKAVSIENVEPDKESVLNSDRPWPIVNKLYVTTKGKAQGIKAKYINFLRSKRGREVMENEGFINLENYYSNEY